jgi:peptidoglycan hydrolase-like protein with peptidoglycan-binding domain
MKSQVNTRNRRLGIVLCGLSVWCSLLLTARSQPAVVQDVPANARFTKNEVIAVQVELRRLGYLKTRLSAELDTETKAAIREYQFKMGMPNTGKLDVATYRSLGLPYPAPKPGEQRVARQPANAKKEESLAGGEKKTASAKENAPASGEKNIVQQAGSGMREGARVGLEKTYDAGSFAASKSKDVTVKGAKAAGTATKQQVGSMIRRNDEDTAPEVAEVFASKPDWNSLQFTVKAGMVTIKLPPKSKVDIGTLVSEVRKVAGVRYVFVIAF